MNRSAEFAPVIAATVGSSEWFALLDRDLRCVHLHRGTLGRVPERLLGVPEADRAAAGLAPALRELAGAVIENGGSRETELAFDDPRFGPRRFEFEFRSLRASDGVVGVLVRSTESTHRRLHARTLRLQARLLEAMTDGVLVVDAQRVVRYANLACENLFGCRPGRLTGEPASVFGGALSAYLESACPATVEDVPGHPTTLTIDSSAGAPRRVVRCRTSALSFDDERHHLIVLTDVTELHRLEREVLDAETRERERLARDMHDGLGQELTAVALMLRAIHIEQTRAAPALDAPIPPVIEIVEGLIRSTREMASGIFARPTAEEDLPAALQHLARDVTRRAGVPVECHLSLPLGYPPDAVRDDHLYRIAQESITNALRHAHPTRIAIEFALGDGLLRLAVRDDGSGIAATRAGSSGLGRSIMQFRAHAAGGDLRIEPELPHGTRVEFRAVLPRRVP